MFITKTHKYKKDGIVIVGGDIPDGSELLETLTILNAEEGYELIRISDGEKVSSCIWLKDGDVRENYTEIKIEEEVDEQV